MIVEKRFFKRRDVLKIFDIHRNTFSNWIKTGKLSTVIINRHHYVPEHEIIRLTTELKHTHKEVICSKDHNEIE